MSEAGALQNKVAVVTGGSSGIGAETVKLLAKEGARVVITYNNGEDRAQQLRGSLPGTGHSIARLVLHDPASARALADKVKSEYGRCDILVNSAGFTKPVAHNNLDALDETLFDEVLIGNVRGPYSVCLLYTSPSPRD